MNRFSIQDVFIKSTASTIFDEDKAFQMQSYSETIIKS